MYVLFAVFDHAIGRRDHYEYSQFISVSNCLLCALQHTISHAVSKAVS